MSDPKTIGEDVAQRWLAGPRSIVLSKEEAKALDEAEAQLMKLVDEVVAEWRERGG